MNWLSDYYTIAAADLVGGYCGRGYSHKIGRWGNLVAAMESQRMSPHHLRSLYLRAQRGGRFSQGLVIMAHVWGDPTTTTYMVPWFQGVQSKGQFLRWTGSQPMLCGFEWRIQRGGVLAGDVISVEVGYE